ncbi:hypothetical protein E2C01_090276 [Portunus trituberculatus]|uniref:Uncharacterized protein n=1 Tax=Portunus trituberculatus TaxID=210409 RepID=A0A5B7JE95_PORTR|nr:hypothetical protein [Portunus trituberculatus]
MEQHRVTASVMDVTGKGTEKGEPNEGNKREGERRRP